MVMISMGSDIVRMGHLFFDLEMLCKKMILDIFKLFPSVLRDVITPHFHPIEKYWCHQSMCSQIHNMISNAYYFSETLSNAKNNISP